MEALQVTNPITNRVEKLNVFMADRAEMGLLHMITSNPARSPSFTMFGNPITSTKPRAHRRGWATIVRR